MSSNNNLSKPIIGVTCHFVSDSLPRSGMVQLYLDAVAAAGGAPVGIPLALDRATLRTIFESLDGVMLPGGDDVAPQRYNSQPHPRLSPVDEQRDELELTMAQWALQEKVPILGICRGIQVLAVAAGGTLYQDIPSELDSALEHWSRGMPRDHLSHVVAINESSRLAAAVGRTSGNVNSFHHQSVRDVPHGFDVTARSEDDVIEAIEAPDHPFAVGVQCHPEGLWQTTAPEYAGLFRAFVEAAGQHRSQRAI